MIVRRSTKVRVHFSQTIEASLRACSEIDNLTAFTLQRNSTCVRKVHSLLAAELAQVTGEYRRWLRIYERLGSASWNSVADAKMNILLFISVVDQTCITLQVHGSRLFRATASDGWRNQFELGCKSTHV